MTTRAAVIVLFALGAAVLASSEDSPIPEPTVSDPKDAVAITAAAARGSQAATKDIERGVLRILDYGPPLPPGMEHRTDPETGYILQNISGCVVTERFIAEVDAYNRTMRTWHANHRS